MALISSGVSETSDEGLEGELGLGGQQLRALESNVACCYSKNGYNRVGRGGGGE